MLTFRGIHLRMVTSLKCREQVRQHFQIVIFSDVVIFVLIVYLLVTLSCCCNCQPWAIQLWLRLEFFLINRFGKKMEKTIHCMTLPELRSFFCLRSHTYNSRWGDRAHTLTAFVQDMLFSYSFYSRLSYSWGTLLCQPLPLAKEDIKETLYLQDSSRQPQEKW